MIRPPFSSEVLLALAQKGRYGTVESKITASARLFKELGTKFQMTGFGYWRNQRDDGRLPSNCDRSNPYPVN